MRDAAQTPLAGRTVYIDENRNNRLDSGEPTTKTAADGSYQFTGLAAGKYCVREALPSGWRASNPGSGYFEVSVADRQAVAGRNFAQTQLGLISGVVFNDANHNGKQDKGEKGLVGVVVYIDANNNAKLDKGEITAVTDPSGHYQLAAPAGKYHLRVVPKRSSAHVTPLARVVTLVAGKVLSGESFAVS